MTAVPPPDGLCFSYHKMGRTWLRFALASLLCDIHQLNVDLDFHSVFGLLPNAGDDPLRGLPAWEMAAHPGLPLVVFDHRPFPAGCGSTSGAPVILLLRHLLDTLVSKYHQDRYRRQVFHGDLAAFLMDPTDGIRRMGHFLNSWALQARAPHVLLIRYEDMHANFGTSLARAASHLGWKSTPQQRARAQRLSSFGEMQHLERTAGFPTLSAAALAGGTRALRARKGHIGSFWAHKTEVQWDRVCDAIRQNLTPQALALVDKEELLKLPTGP